MNSNLPAGAEHDSNAPWNQSDDTHTCLNCMEEIPDDKAFCSKWCAEEYDL